VNHLTCNLGYNGTDEETLKCSEGFERRGIRYEIDFDEANWQDIRVHMNTAVDPVAVAN
jgi:hypothetical protein